MSEDKLWGGRFDCQTDRLVEAYTASVDTDKHFALQDIAGSKAHAAMLAAQGVITASEAQSLRQGLDQVAEEIAAGSFEWRTDLEDVHMNVEQRLTELVGQTGQKLHTGRSRNDQVALGFRLLVSERVTVWQEHLCDVIQALVEQAEQHPDTILPGYTHLQPAQPVRLAQHVLAYAAMFRRDWERLHDAQQRIRVSPLGAAALAGTTYPLDPQAVAQELGFSEVFSNSMDAVADRDFVLEPLFAASCIAMHLSRLCEEIILWANPGFGFVRLPDAFATGSSIMPQKKNPDVAEIMRGKTGRVYGDLLGLLTTLKGLPLTYNRDLQEDKAPFLDADATVSLSLEVMARMVPELQFCVEPMHRATKAGYLNATEFADYLVGKGIPFRQAHHITGQAVAVAEKEQCGLEDLSLEQLRQFSPLVEKDVYTVLDYTAAVNRRQAWGGTGAASVQRQIDSLGSWLAGARKGKSGGSV